MVSGGGKAWKYRRCRRQQEGPNFNCFAKMLLGTPVRMGGKTKARVCKAVIQGDLSGAAKKLFSASVWYFLASPILLGSFKPGRTGMACGEHGETLKQKSTKYSRRLDGSPCIP